MKERVFGWLSSLTAKYVAVFVLLVAVPAIGISSYLLDSSYNDNKQALIRLQEEKADALAGKVEDSLTATIGHLRAVHLEGLSADDVESVLGGIDKNVIPGTAFYIDRTGEVTAASLVGLSVPAAALPTARKKGFYLSDVDPDLSTMAVVGAENAGSGAVGTQFDTTKIQQLSAGTRLGRSGYAFALTKDGFPIAYPDLKVINDVRFGRIDPFTSLPQVKKALASDASSSSTGRSLSGKKVLSAWATVPTTGWKIFVEEPESAAFAPLRGKIWHTGLIIAGFVVAAIALSVLLARRFVRPIRRMRLAAGRIGAGAYDERIELDPPRPGVPLFHAVSRPDAWGRARPSREVAFEQRLPERHRHDDLGALAEDLNRMAASLQASHTELERKVAERTSELQAVLEQLAEKSRELEQASAHKSEFLANMSHELRTPLNAILGFTQVLQQKLFGEVNAKQDEYLADIHGSANHLLELINDVLDLSKVEAGQVELEKAPFSLREALERGVVMVRERATKNGVRLSLEADANVELVTADERRIRQVVFNLLSNAVKFTPSGGHVDVRSAQENGEVLVSVKDTGPGISAEDQERIFEEFQQTELGQEQKDGTGLGLALSRKLVELHGGRIWVESEPGHGATFTFTLPVEAKS